MRKRRGTAGLITGVGLVAGTLLATAVPAQAYSPDPTTTTSRPDTDTCLCQIGDSRFEHDADGIALRVVLRDDANRYVGKLEFHPYGEVFKAYDTLDDGDTFYFRYRFWVAGEGGPGDWFNSGMHRATGDPTVVNTDFAEGQALEIELFDDVDRTDQIGTVWSART